MGLKNLLVAIDPGGTYGVAIARIDVTLVDVEAYEAQPYDALCQLEVMLGVVERVFCESFIPRPGIRTNQPEALEGIGALRFICTKAGVPFELQSPADAKRFSTNDKLKRLGWYKPTRGGHANDALRHLLLGAVRHGMIGTEEYMEPELADTENGR